MPLPDYHPLMVSLGSVVTSDPAVADQLGHLAVVVVVVLCTTALVAMHVVDPALAGTVFGAALGFSGGLSSRRRSEDYNAALPGGARRTDPPAQP